MARRQAETVMSLSQRPFFMLYQDFLESSILKNCFQKIVYICLKFFADDKGRCFPSLKQLAKLAKISINKVQRTIDELVQMGLVKKEHRTRPDGGIDSNLYKIQDSVETWAGRQRPDGKRPFIKVYRDFFTNDKLDNCYQKLVYIYLGKFANSDQKCFPSIRTLAGLASIGISKVKYTINELIQKGMIDKENRKKQDGSKTSNLYTLSYNLKEKFNIGKSKKIDVEKEKGLDSTPAKVKNQAPTSINTGNYTTSNPQDCQEFERYSFEFIRKHFHYGIIISEMGVSKDDLDAVMSVLYDTLNTTNPTITVNGDRKPSQVVISQLLKMPYWVVGYAIDQYKKQDRQRIRNPKAYMRSILYNATTGGYNLDIENRVAYDMAHFDEDAQDPEDQEDP